MNRENLKKLADYLLSNGLKATFDMNHFAAGNNLFAENCGSIGCAIGHGPYAGIIKLYSENWWIYSDKNFMDSDEHFREWTWCFDSDWKSRDNTAQGAAKRIIWLLEHGLPDNWDGQLYRNAPLCYEV